MYVNVLFEVLTLVITKVPLYARCATRETGDGHLLILGNTIDRRDGHRHDVASASLIAVMSRAEFELRLVLVKVR